MIRAMAVKTITIDMEAYELLSRSKRAGQSFSQVIKEHFSSAKRGRDLKAALRDLSISEEALDAIEGQVKGRAEHAARSLICDPSGHHLPGGPPARKPAGSGLSDSVP